MTLMPLPQPLCIKIASHAMQSAQKNLRDRNWTSSGNIHSAYGEGEVGLRTSLDYLMYQNTGIRPFVMRSLEGKVVPIDGRFVTAKGVGQPGYVRLPGGVRKWRDQKWRHPGLQPKRFLEQAIAAAIRDAAPEVKEEVMAQLKRSLR